MQMLCASLIVLAVFALLTRDIFAIFNYLIYAYILYMGWAMFNWCIVLLFFILMFGQLVESAILIIGM